MMKIHVNSEESELNLTVEQNHIGGRYITIEYNGVEMEFTEDMWNEVENKVSGLFRALTDLT